MRSPMSAVSQLLSAFSAAFTSRCIRHAAACLIFPLRIREAHFAISLHVPSLIQSFLGAQVGLGSTHSAASASKRAVFASFCPDERDSGNFWCAHQYFFSRPVLAIQMLATIARWSEWRNLGDQNPTPLKCAISPARAINSLAACSAESLGASGSMSIVLWCWPVGASEVDTCGVHVRIAG